MKLSEIKGERAIDAIADLIEPIARIAEDKEAAKLFKRERCPKGQTARAFLLKRIRTSVPVLLRNHKADLIEIMATVEGVSPEVYAQSLSVAKLIGDIFGLLNDGEFLSLFGLAQETEETSSGSAQAGTQEVKV